MWDSAISAACTDLLLILAVNYIRADAVCRHVGFVLAHVPLKSDSEG